MTAGEIAAATGLGRATVSTTLSKLAGSGEIEKATRGYQLHREHDTPRKRARSRPSRSTVATNASPPATEPPATNQSPPDTEPPATETIVAERPSPEPIVAEPPSPEPIVAEPPTPEPLVAADGDEVASVEPAQRFYFPTAHDGTPGAVAANLLELEAAIAVSETGVLRHHCAGRDFSRWIDGVLHNEPLAAAVATAEAQLSAESPTETVDAVRGELIAALQSRHATPQ